MVSKALKEAINSLPSKLNLSLTERGTKYVEEASRVRLTDLKNNPGHTVKVGSLCFDPFSHSFRLVWFVRSITIRLGTLLDNLSVQQSRQLDGFGEISTSHGSDCFPETFISMVMSTCAESILLFLYWNCSV